ncbi:hypothetical protein V7S43_000264 [Phytophthora oleae]|uniref:Uncharacterized protein n=1 Tax=Phytophthora oleae TaxID=2107226 RepID=A0ABD3G767_9STRA
MEEPQELADGLVLHLIRTIALYLFVFLSQTTVADAELAVLVSSCTTTDVLDEQTVELQRRLHETLLTWVESEENNNQFDGLLQEQRAFVVIKKLFRQQRTKAADQCRVLAALLTCYLARMETPLVRCEPSSMLSSTLEYLLAMEKHKEPVPLPMLYPLVNAVDLVTIEQRECLDALMNLLRWLSAHDRTQKGFSTFASKYHAKIIEMTEDSRDNSDALGVCFVQMLLCYSDHIFRRDLQFDDLVPTLSYSDTKDDDASSEENCPKSRHDIPDNLSEDFEKTKTTHEPNQKQEVFKTSGVVMKEETILMTAPEKITSQAKSRSFPIHEEERLLISKMLVDEEPLLAAVCVGIAAAGTFAAALCRHPANRKSNQFTFGRPQPWWLTVGQTFEGGRAATAAVKDYALSNNRQVAIIRSGGGHKRFGCSSKDCGFFVQLYQNQVNDRKIKTWHIGSLQLENINRTSVAKVTGRQLRELPSFRNAVLANPSISGPALANLVQRYDGILTPADRSTIYRQRDRILEDKASEEVGECQKIPSLLDGFTASNPGSYTAFQTDAAGRFL